METIKPHIGTKYNNFTVISEIVKKAKAGHRMFEVQCDCGLVYFKSVAYLRRHLGNYCQSCKGILTYKGGEHVSGTYFLYIQKGCKRRSQIIEFNLTLKYIDQLFLIQNKKCKLSGVDISFEDKTASLDRIDSTKGYIEGNVQWLHKDVNRMKLNFSQDYFIKFCKLISTNNEN